MLMPLFLQACSLSYDSIGLISKHRCLLTECRNQPLPSISGGNRHSFLVDCNLLSPLVRASVMFKKFQAEEDISSTSQVKNSVQRAIQTQIVEQYPLLEDAIDSILPKKAMLVGRGPDGTQLLIVNNEILFFSIRDGIYFPTLKLLHKYPSMMNWMQVDKGAIRFVLGGANIMCPGFTSAGGYIPKPLPEHTPVAIYAEGKEHAMALGITKMSTDDIISKNKGQAVETVHYLMDGLWQTKSL